MFFFKKKNRRGLSVIVYFDVSRLILAAWLFIGCGSPLLLVDMVLLNAAGNDQRIYPHSSSVSMYV